MGITDMTDFCILGCFVPPGTCSFFLFAIELMEEEQVDVPRGLLLLDDGAGRQSSRHRILTLFNPFTLDDFLVIGSSGNLI